MHNNDFINQRYIISGSDIIPQKFDAKKKCKNKQKQKTFYLS